MRLKIKINFVFKKPFIKALKFLICYSKWWWFDKGRYLIMGWTNYPNDCYIDLVALNKSKGNLFNNIINCIEHEVLHLVIFNVSKISGYKSEYVLSLMSKNNVWKKILY